MNFFEKVTLLCKEKNSLLCVGLDPVVNASSQEEAEQQIIAQNKALIEATAEYTVCYKPNIAFYEAWGAAGHRALLETMKLIPSEIPVLLDAKRGDIGNTAEAYATAAFDEIGADGITLSPYMGQTSAEPFIKYADKGFFQLCRTSNPGAGKIQEIKTENGDSLFIEVGKEAISWAPERTGLVVAGNDPVSLKAVRAAMPDVWMLSPGIGAQGGKMEEAISAGLRADGLGILPVVVRAIAGAKDPKAATKEFVDELNAARSKVLAERAATSGNGCGCGCSSSCNDNNTVSELKQAVLKGLIETECFRLGEFTLKSGKLSPFYVDLRRTSASAQLMKLIGKAYTSLMPGLKFDSIAGIPVAALSLATAASMESGFPMIYPRMVKKEHGAGNNIEGAWKPGDRILLLDDLITTGKSKIEAIEILREAGLIVEDLVVLLERGVQGRKDMEAAGVRLHSFAQVEELFKRCEELKIIDKIKHAQLLAYTKEA